MFTGHKTFLFEKVLYNPVILGFLNFGTTDIVSLVILSNRGMSCLGQDVEQSLLEVSSAQSPLSQKL